MDMNDIPPERMQQILAQHPELLQEADPNAPILAAIKALSAQVEAMGDRLNNLEQHVSKLESVVMDQIIGGLTDMYNKSSRDQGLASIQQKYGDLFSPLADGFKYAAQLGGNQDADMFSSLYDLIDGMKKDGTWSEEAELAKMQEAAQQLVDFLQSLKSAPDVSLPAKEEPKPEGKAAPTEQKPADETKESTSPSMDDKITALAGRYRNRRTGYAAE